MSIEHEIRFFRGGGALLAPAGFSSPEALLGGGRTLWIGPLLRRSPSTGRRRLSGSLTSLSLSGSGMVPYVMRFPAATAAEARRAAGAELAALGLLEGAGAAAAPPVATGFGPFPAAGGPSGCRRAVSGYAAFVVVRAPEEAVPLASFLEEGGRVAGGVAARLARRIASIHGAGLRVPGLCPWNVLVLPGEGSILFLGSLGACPSRRPPRRFVPSDLAPLSAGLEAAAASRALRFFFLEKYIDEARSFLPSGDARSLWRKVEGEERLLRRSGLLPSPFPLVEKIFPEGYLQVVPFFEADLEKSGFATVSDFLFPSGRGVRRLREKENRSNFVVETGKGRYFLKVHREGPQAAPPRGIGPGVPPFSSRSLFPAFLSPEGRRLLPEGFREWRGYLSLRRFGLPVPPPAAWGFGKGFSFFAVRDEGGVPLDDLLRGRGEIPAGEGERPGGAEAFRRGLAREAGRLVGRFHGAGFFHHDLYLCHLLAGAWGLRFIDLQRLDEAPLFRRHGIIKDLAALCYSSLATPATGADRIRFFRAWSGGGPLSVRDRRLLAAVKRKCRAIAARAERSGGVEESGKPSAGRAFP